MTMHPNDATLNDYVEGSLDAAGREDVERHLAAGCAECRAAIDDLREIRQVASTLQPIAPPAGVWERLEAAIGSDAARTPARRYPWTWLAAAAVLAIAAGAAIWLGPLAARHRAAPAQPAAATDAQSRELAASVEAELREAESHYQKAITGLEQIANEGKGSLDPQTAATLEKNLQVVDQAISESRAALRTQPDSEPAQQSLLESFKSKIALLQDTVALINEMRKGNDAGAARIVSGLKQKS
ncbi:MAG: hypothetical protein ACM3SQ_15700 [Betaproteobacteria bacterium]